MKIEVGFTSKFHGDALEVIKIAESKAGKWAIVERTSETGRPQWEVCKIQVAKSDYTFPNGAVVETGHETLPSNNQWGTYGFTCVSLERAEELLAKKSM